MGGAGGGGGTAVGGLIEVEASSFMMGCSPAEASQCDNDEEPYHQVQLSAYAIERTEVSQAAYQACVDAAACTLPAANFDPIAKGQFPVTAVTWLQAKTYCEWRGGRLPTEAEWERAARGTDERIFPWGDDEPDCSFANIDGCGGVAQEVDSNPNGASPIGALNMIGNVYEWIADYYGNKYYFNSPLQDPTGPATGDARAVRGAGFAFNQASDLRAAKRGALDPDSFGPTGFGFRCAQ